jgi:hypothetical protein
MDPGAMNPLPREQDNERVANIGDERATRDLTDLVTPTVDRKSPTLRGFGEISRIV